MRDKILVVVTSALIACLCATSASADEWWEQLGEGCGKEITDQVAATKGLNEEMSLLNLINGLYLTEPQIKVIADCAAEASKARESFVADNIAAVKDFRAALEELKCVLEKNAGIPKDLEERVKQKETTVLRVKSDYFARLKGLQDRVDSALSDGQKAVIADFNPCIIPPENLKNPVRVGQASDTSELETHLASLRKMPEKAFDRLIGPLLDELLKGMELRFGKSTEEERKAEKARMLDVIDRARAMSDEEFQLNKTPLAKEILKTHDEFIENVHGFVKIISKVTGGLDKTGTFLLNPRIVPLLEKRIELMKSGGLAPADLDALTGDKAAGAG